MRYSLSILVLFVPAVPLCQVNLPGIPRPCFWENQPLQYRVTPTGMIMESGPKTDWFRDPNVTYNTDNAPKLLFTADENFVIKGSLRHDFTEKWDGGALVLKGDSLHWIKFCFEKDYLGMHRVVTVVTNNISDDCNSVALPGDQVYYKMAKSKNEILLDQSPPTGQTIVIAGKTYTAPLEIGRAHV